MCIHITMNDINFILLIVYVVEIKNIYRLSQILQIRLSEEDSKFIGNLITGTVQFIKILHQIHIQGPLQNFNTENVLLPQRNIHID